MTTFNGKRVNQRGGAGSGRGDDAHGVTSVSRMKSVINGDPVVTPMVTNGELSVADVHDVRVYDNSDASSAPLSRK